MKENIFPVSVIIPTRNASTTILNTLESVANQDNPIQEIIIVDNVSKDTTIAVIEKFSKIHKNIPIKLLVNKKNLGVGNSYNRGVSLAKANYVILMHSDSSLPTKREVRKLTEPFRKGDGVVATCSYVLHPEKLWLRYNFWLKYLLARGVGKELPALSGKFDCIDKKTFFKIKGFDDKNYGQHIGIGSDDADFHIRLKKVGKVVLSKAKVVHLHYQGDDYSFHDLTINRKLLARSYGSLIRLHWSDLGVGALAFAVKPSLVMISVIPFLFPFSILLLFLFAIWYMNRMYRTPSVLRDLKIFLLPFVTIFFIFYETFWMVESMFVKSKK